MKLVWMFVAIALFAALYGTEYQAKKSKSETQKKNDK